MALTIKSVNGREVLDSRGNPTVEVELRSTKHTARAMVPSGVSTGKYEALELRNGDARFHGKGVLKAVANVNTVIAKKLTGMSITSQEEIDNILLKLDSTADKSKLGANAILGVSLSLARLRAAHAGLPLYEHLTAELKPKQKWLLPIPFCNVINGGSHAGNNLAVQEFMIVPTGAKSFSEAIRSVSEVYHELKKLILKNSGKNAVNVGDEGGFAPPLDETEEALLLITEAIDRAGYGKSIKLALDVAASEFFAKDSYHIDGKILSAEDLLVFYEKLVEEYPFVSIEDPFDQDSFGHFADLTAAIGNTCQIVGDDLLVTNPCRIQVALKQKSCNALLLKVNQIGTLSEAVQAAKMVQKAGWNVMVSHRSGETEDSFIADLAVALGCGQLKCGGLSRGERTAKYNQLLRIEEELGKKARYPTWPSS